MQSPAFAPADPFLPSPFFILPSPARVPGRGFFAEAGGIRMNRGSPNGKFPLPQRIEHPQLFRHGPGGKLAALGAFAFKDLLQVEAHGQGKG
jgi:hypothetical protein